VGVARMVLEARTLEILHDHAATRVNKLLTDRIAKERQRFACGRARITKLQTVRLPVRLETGTEPMSRFSVERAVRVARRRRRQRLEGRRPQETIAGRALVAEASQFGLIRRTSKLGVIFKALPLSELHRVAVFTVFTGQRIAEDREPAARRPEVLEAVREIVLRLREIDPVRIRRSGIWFGRGWQHLRDRNGMNFRRFRMRRIRADVDQFTVTRLWVGVRTSVRRNRELGAGIQVVANQIGANQIATRDVTQPERIAGIAIVLPEDVA